MTSCSIQWPLSFQTKRKSFALQINWNECWKTETSRSYGYFRRHRSRGDLRNKSKRRSITMHFGQVWQSLSCQKVCCTFSVLLCCFLLFSGLVHCRRRVLQLANNVTSHNNYWYATISLKNQPNEGKRPTKTTSAGTAHREALLLMHV